MKTPDARGPDDPVIEEIRAIREEIYLLTKDFSDQELLDWYEAEARKFLSRPGIAHT